jgi:hypothetical protein
MPARADRKIAMFVLRCPATPRFTTISFTSCVLVLLSVFYFAVYSSPAFSFVVGREVHLQMFSVHVAVSIPFSVVDFFLSISLRLPHVFELFVLIMRHLITPNFVAVL